MMQLASSFLSLCIVLSSVECDARAQSPSHPYLSPAAIATQQVLQAPCEQGFERNTLEVLLDGVSLSFEIPIWCDRRIARDTLVALDKRNDTLASFLNRAIEDVDAVVIPLGGVLVVAPRSEQSAIEAAYWKISTSRIAIASSSKANKPFGWPDATAASAVLDEFSLRYSLEPKLAMDMDLDIWRAFEFPKSATMATIAVCLTSGFNKCIEEREGKLTVVPIDAAEANVEWSYTKDEIEKKIGPTVWKTWRHKWPDAKVTPAKPASNGWRVSATAAAHRELIQPMVPAKKWDAAKPSEPKAVKAFSGPMEGELELVIRSLAAQAKLEFFPIPLPSSLESKKVSLKLNKSTIEEILKEITVQTGVQFKIDGKRVEIIPK
jgi:hypothetical protein